MIKYIHEYDDHHFFVKNIEWAFSMNLVCNYVDFYHDIYLG